jgi:hypothetical protein
MKTINRFLMTISLLLIIHYNGNLYAFNTKFELFNETTNQYDIAKCWKIETMYYPSVPGVVINHSAKSSGIFLGSPSICKLPNGNYIVSCDLNSIGGSDTAIVNSPRSLIFRSTNGGGNWTKIATIVGQFWSQLFYHKNELYIIGTERSGGDILIRKSTDEGVTWTTPTDSLHGRILKGKYSCGPTPVVFSNGRLWKGMEDNLGGGSVWGQAFRTFMLSISENADLLRASNWTASNKLAFNSNYLNGDFGGWLEGNAVLTPSGDIVNILRTNYQLNSDEKASIVSVSNDGRTATFDPINGFIDFPGGCKKFAIRYDSISQNYWSLCNYVPDIDKGLNAERTRNTLALIRSSDLHHWEIVGIILHHPDIDFHAFQYADFQFENDDIIAVSRTAYSDEEGEADSQHNANFLTFHRIQNFRSYQTPEELKYLIDPDPVLGNGILMVQDTLGKPVPGLITYLYDKVGINDSLISESKTDFAGLMKYYRLKPNKYILKFAFLNDTSSISIISGETTNKTIVVKPYPIELSKQDWTILSYSSQENSTNYAVKNIIDNNIATFWNSSWSITPRPTHPHEIIIDMDKINNIKGFVLANANKSSGAEPIKDFRMYVSSDSLNWEDVGTFEQKEGDGKQYHYLLTNKQCRYFKLSTINQWSSYSLATVALAEIGAF